MLRRTALTSGFLAMAGLALGEATGRAKQRIRPQAVDPAAPLIFTVRFDTTRIDAGESDSITRRCASGEQVTGGGCSFGVNGDAKTVLTESKPNGAANNADGWTCSAKNAHDSGFVPLEVYVVCASVTPPPE